MQSGDRDTLSLLIVACETVPVNPVRNWTQHRGEEDGAQRDVGEVEVPLIVDIVTKLFGTHMLCMMYECLMNV